MEDDPAHEFIFDSEEARAIFSQVYFPTEKMNELISALGKRAYSAMEDQLFQRLDTQKMEDQMKPLNMPGKTRELPPHLM